MQVRGAECVIIAGDPQQLPPTVSAPQAIVAQLDRTVFERLQVRYILLSSTSRSLSFSESQAGFRCDRVCEGYRGLRHTSCECTSHLHSQAYEPLPSSSVPCIYIKAANRSADWHQNQAFEHIGSKLTAVSHVGMWAAALAAGHPVPHAPCHCRVPISPVLQGPHPDRALCRGAALAPRCCPDFCISRPGMLLASRDICQAVRSAVWWQLTHPDAKAYSCEISTQHAVASAKLPPALLPICLMCCLASARLSIDLPAAAACLMVILLQGCLGPTQTAQSS